MEQAEHEPNARTTSGNMRSPLRPTQALDGDTSSAALAPRSDPNLESTLRAFTDLSYRELFWPGRRYDDLADRLALRAFLPPTGERLIEVGAGFGRLSDEYSGYRDVVLLDASEALIQAARERLGGTPRFTIVAGDAYQLPFPDASFDAVVCVRVLHYFEDPRPAILEFARVLRPGGVLVVEYANKRHLRGILARLLRRQRWSPFATGSHAYEDISLLPTQKPISRVRSSSRPAGPAAEAPRWSSSTSFLHAPGDMRSWLRSAGFRLEATRSVGLFRLPFLTSHLPVRLLVGVEKLQQSMLGSITPGPSVFLKAVRRPGTPVRPVAWPREHPG
jgi:SAM-dependent methyltransferase